jgi:hypothetical protein
MLCCCDPFWGKETRGWDNAVLYMRLQDNEGLCHVSFNWYYFFGVLGSWFTKVCIIHLGPKNK